MGCDTGVMRLVSWNVAGKIDGARAPRLCAQVQALAEEQPDVVALREITCASDAQWRARSPTLACRTFCRQPSAGSWGASLREPACRAAAPRAA